MKSYVIAVDQSTSATKALLFEENGILAGQTSIPHKQYYPKEGWVEHDAEEIYDNTVQAIRQLVAGREDASFSIAITNQRETVVVWDKETGKPVYNAVVWQCMRGKEICDDLIARGFSSLVKERCGLLIDPYFSGSGIKWILDNVPDAREDASRGRLLMGNMDSWLIWKLTEGAVHATDYTNASRTMLFNIHTMDWDDDLLDMLDIPKSMLPEPRPCDSVFGSTTVEGLFHTPVMIAGDLGDSHGALAGQMCFYEGLGKATYGTGSSVMVNIGGKASPAPEGLVTSVGFAALGKVFYAYEGNIHCTGATVAWLKDELGIIDDVAEAERLALSVPSNGGVYFVPAFAGLGAPWWKPDAKAVISGLGLGTGKAHVCRAALESIAYQIKDLIGSMVSKSGISLNELRVDGGPTKNKFLMQFQADLLGSDIVLSETTDASALGAFVMNGFARRKWCSFEQVTEIWHRQGTFMPSGNTEEPHRTYSCWRRAVENLINN